VHLGGSRPQIGFAPAGQGCTVVAVIVSCQGAGVQHTVEAAAIAAEAGAGAEAGVVIAGAGVEADAEVEAGAEVEVGAGVEAGAGVGVDAEADGVLVKLGVGRSWRWKAEW